MKFIKRNRWLFATIVTVVAFVAVLGVNLKYNPPLKQFEVTVGTVAEASGTVDYVCDGTDDNIQLQGALDALPANGGRIYILAGNYDFANLTTVTRAIDNVTILGTGRGSYITCDGATAIFTAGGNNWTISNLRTDAGGLSMGATTGWSWENVTVNATYYAYRVDDTTTASSFVVPTGRSSSYFVAASNATANEIAQADYVCDGTADQTEINAAITAAGATGGKILLSRGTFTIAGNIEIKSNIYLQGQGMGATIIKAAAGFPSGRMINYDGTAGVVYASNITISDLQVDGSKALFADAQPRLGICIIYGHQITVFNTYVHDIYAACGITIGHTGDAAPFNGANIFDNWIIDTDCNGIDATGAGVNYASFIHNNKIRGSKWNGITLDGNNARIINNYVVNSSTGNPATYYSIYITGNKHQVKDNFMSGGSVLAQFANGAVTELQLRSNMGWITENSGTATLLNANTSITVAHGLAAAPTNIQITWKENPTNVIADWWIGGVDATNFVLNGVDPGASNLDFYWRASVGAGN